MLKRYIGKETPDLLARLDRHAALKAEAAERQQRRLRLLRAEGLPGIDAATGNLLAALARSGVFRLGGTLVGTQAFLLYEGELGVRFSSDDTAAGGDIDIASFEPLSLALDDAAEPSVAAMLADFAFDPVPSLDRGAGAAARRWDSSRPRFARTRGSACCRRSASARSRCIT